MKTLKELVSIDATCPGQSQQVAINELGLALAMVTTALHDMAQPSWRHPGLREEARHWLIHELPHTIWWQVLELYGARPFADNPGRLVHLCRKLTGPE